MVPVILILVGRPPPPSSAVAAASARKRPPPRRSAPRRCAMSAFLTVSIAFALVLFAQVGFIVHLIAFLDPVIGREQAATAVALLTAMAMVGRVLFSTVIDRLNQRLASAISFVKSGRGARDHHQFAQRNGADRGLRAVRIFGRQSDHAAVADRAARIRSALLRRADQPDHGDQPGHLCVRPGSYRPAARCVRKLRPAVLRLHRTGADRGGADHGAGARRAQRSTSS